jgi:hypothetical protein
MQHGVDDDIQISSSLQVTCPLYQSKRWDVRPGDRANLLFARELAFTGGGVAQPVGLGCRVSIDVGKTERFEPPRGSRAQVSIGGHAAHNDRAPWVGWS